MNLNLKDTNTLNKNKDNDIQFKSNSNQSIIKEYMNNNEIKGGNLNIGNNNH